MAREKKITIKLVINTSLNSSWSSANGKRIYPIYVQMTYDRKTTNFPLPGGYQRLAKDEGEALARISQTVKPQIQRIAEHERDRKEDFTVRGFSLILDKYTFSLKGNLEAAIYYLVDDELKGVLTVKEYEKVREERRVTDMRNVDFWISTLNVKLPARIELLLTATNLALKKCKVDFDVTIEGWLLLGKKQDYISSCKLSNQEIQAIDRAIYMIIDEPEMNFQDVEFW